MPRRKPNEQEREMVDLYRQGATYKEIGDRYGMTWREAYQAIRGFVVPLSDKVLRRRRRIWKSRASIAEAYRSGATLRELGRQYDVSHEWIRTLLQREGVELRKRGTAS